jgi:hypothetical protein
MNNQDNYRDGNIPINLYAFNQNFDNNQDKQNDDNPHNFERQKIEEKKKNEKRRKRRRARNICLGVNFINIRKK